MGAGYKQLLPGTIGLGLALQLLGYYIIGGFLGGVIIAVGWVFLFLGCLILAQGKGYHPIFAALALLHLPGLIILFLLPERK